jgi:hypothetical protein
MQTRTVVKKVEGETEERNEKNGAKLSGGNKKKGGGDWTSRSVSASHHLLASD